MSLSLQSLDNLPPSFMITASSEDLNWGFAEDVQAMGLCQWTSPRSQEWL